jgi:phosphoadenosine phosphosulfate reductase
LKEGNGAGTVTITGVRRAESAKRAKRNIYEVTSHKFSSDSEDDFEEWRINEINKQLTKNTNRDQFSEQGETEVRCINGKDKIIINPIIEWSDKDVWEFLNKVVRIEHCELYDKGYHRLGCLFCPMASMKELRRMETDYPKYKRQFLRTIRKLRLFREDNGMADYYQGMTDEDVFQWWLSKQNLEKWKAENIYTNDLFKCKCGF